MKKHLSPIEQLLELFNKDLDKLRKEYLETKSMRALRELSLIEDVIYQLKQKLDYEKEYHLKKQRTK
jgi:hypothetical protein